jgi:CBS domain containing-hemolysin-like protein
MLTDRDIVVRSAAEGGSPAEADVRSAMTSQVIACCEDDEIEGAATQVERGAVRRLVVLDASKKLVGMLSVDDIALRSPTLAGEILEHVPCTGAARDAWAMAVAGDARELTARAFLHVSSSPRAPGILDGGSP